MAIELTGASYDRIAGYPALPEAVGQIVGESTISGNPADLLGSAVLPSKQGLRLQSTPQFEDLPARPGVVVEATVILDPLKSDGRNLFLTMVQIGRRVALVVADRVVAIRELGTAGSEEDPTPHYKDLVLHLGRGDTLDQQGVIVSSGRGMGPSRTFSTPIPYDVDADELVSLTLPADMKQDDRLSRGVSARMNGGQLALRWSLRPTDGTGGEASTLFLNSDPATPPVQATYTTEVSAHALSSEDAAVVEAWMSPLFKLA